MNRRLFSNRMSLKKGNKFCNKSYCTVTPEGKVKAPEDDGKGKERKRGSHRFSIPIVQRRPTRAFCFLNYCYFYRNTKREPMQRREQPRKSVCHNVM